MNILYTEQNYREGNDCWIKESTYLVEDHGKHYKLTHLTVSGWSGEDSWKCEPVAELELAKEA